jgi:DNA polymerase III delta prime subunit
MLFHGPEGTGKFLAAKEFAKALNCTGPEERPGERAEEDGLFAETRGQSSPPGRSGPSDDACGSCVSCSQADKGVHPDMRVIDSEFQGFLLDEDSRKQKTLRIDTVREFSRYVHRKPILSPWKVFIINDAHTLNKAAQNAMLKGLEEPPPNTVFVLVAAKKHLLLPTILSRSCAVEFGRLPSSAVTEILERGGMPSEEASALSGFAGGSVAKAGSIKKVRDRAAGAASGPQKIFRLVSGLPREPYLAREEAKLMLEMLLESARKNWLAQPPGKAASDHAALIRKLMKYRRFLNQNVSHGLTLEAALLECARLSVRLTGQ